MSKLTESARGEDCCLNIYPYCCENPETVVFCHAPSADKGMGKKSPDWWGAFGCHICHDYIDGRRSGLSPVERDRIWLRAIYKTMKRRIEKGEMKFE